MESDRQQAYFLLRDIVGPERVAPYWFGVVMMNGHTLSQIPGGVARKIVEMALDIRNQIRA